MKRLFAILFALTATAATVAQAEPTRIAPSVKTPTSFAIFIDRTSYDRCREAVDEYRDAVQADGLGTYIICDDWQSPEPVRECILALAADKRMPLEGVVFIGDIPIAMLRDAQHLSSAFKMNQAADRKKSSIPSDRFYDDFDLKFDFIDRDADNPLYFYYSLRHDSAHHLCSDIYSARIKPLVREGVDKYGELAAYLRKAAAEHRAANRLDNMFVFCGHGYNSEAYDAWAGEQVALREQLPSMRRSGHRIACCTFDTRFPMKRYLMQHLQDETLDVAICHHHGAPDTQYINGYQDVSDVRASIENVKRYLRSKTAGYDDAEKRVGNYMQSLDVPRSWFDLSDSTRMADSLYNRELDIDLLDIYGMKPAARFVMFDACFNGSFHLDEYVAGAYIFGGGKTVTAMANSVNSLQDKWPDRYMGLLACGVRVGQWARGTFYLESHIIGDPTLRFENAEDAKGFNEAMTLHARDDKYWLNTLRKSDYPDIQAYALRRLSENGYRGIVPLLADTFRTSPYGTVRMECLKLLSTKHAPEFTELLPAALEDDYELVRRMAANYIGRSGDDSLIAADVEALVNAYISNRVTYHTSDALALLDPDKTKAEIARRFAAQPEAAFGGSNEAAYIDRVERSEKSLQRDMEYIFDAANPQKRRLSEIKSFRNYHYHRAVPQLIRFAEDPSQDEELRTAAVEALGWFVLSYQRPAIEEAMHRLAAEEASAAVKNEARKTLARLAAY